MKRLISIGLLLIAIVSLNAQETDKLKYIGMPVGGICTGQVYLGGDGQLWNWDIFNVSMLDPGSEGGHRFYINPQAQEKTFENGFGLVIKKKDKTFYRALNQSGFANIKFNGEYPLGKVHYADPTLPITADLRAYSPFIPGDADNSGLPATIMEFTISNISNTDLDIEIMGWLQNMSGFHSRLEKDKHINTTENADAYSRLICENNSLAKEEAPDWGNMTLTLLNGTKSTAKASYNKGLPLYFIAEDSRSAEAETGEKLVGGVSDKVNLAKGESKTFTFIVSWYYPNIHLGDKAHQWKNKENLRHYYSSKFKSAAEVSDYIIDNPWLLEKTNKWNETWYDSGIPKWFLNRTFLNVSTLATNACLRFDDITDDPDNEGRFYTMEGVYLGHGTCTHVFHYEQALGRVFPNLARQLREQIDLGLSYQDNGIIGYRGELSNIGQHDGRGYAVDGHAGTILRIYREHTMAPDKSFLTNNWPKIKQSIQYMIDHDKEKSGKADGILEGIQYNTLDRMWYGKITWISGLYAASLKAGAEMAQEIGDKRFAKTCSTIADLSFENISSELFNGEYFIQELDPDHLDAPNTNIGCHSDQLLGQYWASQVGLGYILPQEQVDKALKSIVKYNYVENYGEYLASADIPIKRWYADEDEPGLIVCTFPKGGSDKAPGLIRNDWEKLVVGYFSEMWTAQEHHLAATLIDEGFIEDAYKIEKAVNTRYSPERRNPYNEIEYGNHYTRAMSSYAPFISASGFTYNGPSGIIGFSPRIDADNYKSAFISAEGWGSFSQKKSSNKLTATIRVEHGQIKLSQIDLHLLKGIQGNTVKMEANGINIPVETSIDRDKIRINFENLTLTENQAIELEIR